MIGIAYLEEKGGGGRKIGEGMLYSGALFANQT